MPTCEAKEEIMEVADAHCLHIEWEGRTCFGKALPKQAGKMHEDRARESRLHTTVLLEDLGMYAARFLLRCVHERRWHPSSAWPVVINRDFFCTLYQGRQAKI